MEQRGHHKVYDEARISCGWMCSANTASVIVRVRGVFLYTNADIYKQNISFDPKYVIGCGIAPMLLPLSRAFLFNCMKNYESLKIFHFYCMQQND